MAIAFGIEADHGFLPGSSHGETYGILAKERGCFYCGEEISRPLIWWHGCEKGCDDRVIFLHPECAGHLASRLKWDSQESLSPSVGMAGWERNGFEMQLRQAAAADKRR